MNKSLTKIDESVEKMFDSVTSKTGDIKRYAKSHKKSIAVVGVIVAVVYWLFSDE